MLTRRLVGLAIVASVAGLLVWYWAAARASRVQPAERAVDANRSRAPELAGGTGWINTPSPLRLADLRGKVVLLDFWTFCCINCIHTLPDLARLEKKYANQLVVIGVHAGKFDNEKNLEHIRKAVLRYEITHPVVNDSEMEIWNAYGVNSWPTLCLIDPEGNLVGRASGEGHYEALDRVISKLVETYRAKKALNERPLAFQMAKPPSKEVAPLSFPGKVLADPASDRLFIADSTHHRIVITTLNGEKIAVCGAGTAGLVDGPYDRARFNDPQGMALDRQTLYVADRKNHAIRALDLSTRTVRTVAGNGGQSRRSGSSGPAKETPLSSPWDVLHAGRQLFIAMAGTHQIWKLDLESGIVGPLAGTGREALVDGPLAQACFAQPSGLATDGVNVYVADSESSSIRRLRLDGQGSVETIVGRGLFDFGDVEGVGDEVRLQHALGVTFAEGKLYVADTYNGKVKVIDPATRSCRALAIPRVPGGKAFKEPGGISAANGKLYVADTNAHRVQVADLKSGAVTPLMLKGVLPPKS